VTERFLRISAAGWLVLVIISSLPQGCSQTSHVNLLANGGFEQQAPYLPEPNGWHATRLPETSDHVEFIWEDSGAHSGQYAVSVRIADIHPPDSIAYNWTRVVDSFNVGSRYETEAWIKTENVTQAPFVVVQCWDSTRTNMLDMASTVHDYPVTGNVNWMPVRVRFTVPEGTQELRVRVGLSAPFNLGGKVWFDDISVTELSR